MAIVVNINTDLLEESKEIIQFNIIDGSGNLQTVDIPSTSIKNPYELDLTHFIPQTQIFSLDRFFELTQKLINDVSSREGKPTITLVEEYPPLDMAKIGNELITFRVMSREPANMSSDGKSRPQRGFRQYYNTKDPNYGDNLIQISNRPLDHEIEFSVWATSNKLANKRVLWLEDLLIKYAWVFRSQGADRFYFVKRLQDSYITTGNQRLFYRPLRFFLRYNDFLVRSGYEIKNIEIDFSITSDLNLEP